MNRIVFVRHGETVGQSSIRYWGATDVGLSDDGRAQMRGARQLLPDEGFDHVVASPLSRAWEGARIVWPSGPIRLDGDFREIDFGRWEGLTIEEIEARDPELFRDFEQRRRVFTFPGGEAREDFRVRVRRGVDRLLAGGSRSALVVVHHGVVRASVEYLTGNELEHGNPPLGGVVIARRRGDGWQLEFPERGPAGRLP